jgi:uncharacterized protein
VASKAITLDDLRRHAVARSLFKPCSLSQAIMRLGFVQADPIRAPARAQDLTLRLRVRGYKAGDLEQRYRRLSVEEDYLVNYGFLPRQHLSLMHPREASRPWDEATQQLAQAVLAFVRQRAEVHPRQVQAVFDQGRVRNAWGGSSNAVTQLLDGMHYRGLLRVARRENGLRIYAPVVHPDDARSPAEKADALVNLVVAKYAPLPLRSLGLLCSFLCYGAPHLQAELKRAQQRAVARLPGGALDGQHWCWPEGEDPRSRRWKLDEELRLLAPFDPIVWDRQRFERLWGWAYRFEAYTPAPKRKLGYYALPLLWHGQVLGWGNLSLVDDRLQARLAYVGGAAPREAGYAPALAAELARLAEFLGVSEAVLLKC